MSTNENYKWYQDLWANMDIEGFEKYPYIKNTEQEVEWLVKEYLINPEMKILDVGCGIGRHDISLAAKGYKNVTAIDLSPGLINAAREIAKKRDVQVNFMVCDARELPFENEFDISLCLWEGAFGLLENDNENYKVLKAIYKSLKKNGLLILTALGLYWSPLAADLKKVHHLNLFEGDEFDPMTCCVSCEIEKVQQDGRKKTIICKDRCYTYPELKWVLQQIGFEVILGAKSFSKEPIQQGAIQFMVISKKL
jgi:ubiquinone/menaquinone biosynthesis C-methylase UbiE